MGGICSSSAVLLPFDRQLRGEGSNSSSLNLIEAAAAGDVETFSLMLARGASVHSLNYSGRSALHLAAAEGHIEIVKLLILYRAEVDINDRFGNQPIYEALANGHEEVVSYLLSSGASLPDDRNRELEVESLRHTGSRDTSIMHNILEDRLSKKISKYVEISSMNFAVEERDQLMAQHLLESGDLNIENRFEDSCVRSGTRSCTIGRGISSNLSESVAAVPNPNTASFAMIEALPPPIALARLQGQDAAPVMRDCASLFYSDVAGFTRLCAGLSACDVAQLLDSLFRRLDHLAYLHGVQKVDVVGDAYIAATNFTEDQVAAGIHHLEPP